MQIILFDDNLVVENLKPFTLSRPLASLRLGFLTIQEKWEAALKEYTHSNFTVEIQTRSYLCSKWPIKRSGEAIYIAGNTCPNKEFIEAIFQLDNEETLWQEHQFLAYRSNIECINWDEIKKARKKAYAGEPILQINQLWDLFQQNGKAIQNDFDLVTKGKTSKELDDSNKIIGDKSMLFIEKGAKVTASIINVNNGPVFIAKDAEIMEGCMIRSPFAMLNNAVLKMGTKVYGASTLGPHCKVGGEINNCIFYAYSNKAHDGFLGNSVIGEWCNLGADTNCSNLKNNYGSIKLWNYGYCQLVDTGQQFCGLFFGDHSKAGINTMFNTGTVVGFSSNVYGADFPEKFIPSFSWGGAENIMDYRLDKALEVAQKMMERRKIPLTDSDIEIFNHLFENSKKYKHES